MHSHWKLKDMIILEPDLANVLTSKVVHKDLRNVLVKFESFWTPTLELLLLQCTVQNLFVISCSKVFPISRTFDHFFRWPRKKMCHPPPVLNREIVAFPASSYGHFCAAQFSKFLE